MKKLFALALVAASTSMAHAEYRTVDMTVFGMDCAPCAHAVHVSVKGINGVDTVNVDLNSGLVAIKFAAGNTAGMRQIEEAIEKNGFTHKDATVTARGKIMGTANALFLEVAGTSDRYTLSPAAQPADLSGLIGKTVDVQGLLPQAAKGKLPDTLRYKSIAEVK
jgi:copper chaperone CopZ